MKKIVLFLVLFCTTTLFSQTFTIDNITYTVSGAEVSVYANIISTPSDIIIPSTVTNGGITYSVTSIGSNAFRDCTSLTSITLPSSLTSIGTSAFRGCYGLTSITLPSSLTSIGNSAFSGCTGLTSITLPSSLTSIGNTAFYGCLGLTSITLPSSLINLGTGAFFGCTGLTSITIPNGVTAIGSSAFENCTSLTSITFPSSLTTIGSYAFQNCTSLTSITFPSSLTTIGSYAFYNCTSLTSISIPSSVTSIGSYAFYGCYGLTSITLPNTLTSMGSNAFRDCTSLTSISLPSSLTSIGTSAFRGCYGLTSITLPNTLTSIGNTAFYGCTGLTSFTINAVILPFISSNAFTGVTVGNVYLYVPTASKTTYKNASVWSGFKFPPYITAPGASTASTSSLSMNENSASVTTFTADETVNWSLGTSNDGALFSINSSGVLVFNAAPDYESTLHNNTYVLEVIATGTISGLTTTQQLTITITDVVVEVLSPNVLSDFNSFTVSANTSDFTINPPTSNSSGAITYTSSNTGVATITGTTVHLVGPGVTTITATQASNGSYLGNSISARMNVNALCGDWGYSLMYPLPLINLIPN